MDEVYIVYTRMERGMKEEVEVEQLLPLKTNQFIKEELVDNVKKGKSNGTLEDFEGSDDYFVIYPSPKVVLNDLAYNYVTGFIYGALVEGFATEENPRVGGEENQGYLRLDQSAVSWVQFPIRGLG